MFYTCDDTAKNKIEKKIEWYDNKSKFNKKCYIILIIIDIIISAFIPFATIFINRYPETQYVVAFMGSVVTIVSGFLATFQFHRLWIDYRITAETLKRHRDLFEENVYPYDGINRAKELTKNTIIIEEKQDKHWVFTEKYKNSSNKEE